MTTDLRAALAETDPARRLGRVLLWFDQHPEQHLQIDAGDRNTLACADANDAHPVVCVPGTANALLLLARRVLEALDTPRSGEA